MTFYRFHTLDVFTDRRFGGNPLAVFPDARGLDATTMQRLAAEMNLSETTFVLPPESSANDARVRIFNRTAEMPFAGHPGIGTAFVLATLRDDAVQTLRLEVPAGVVEATILRDAARRPTGARIAAPQPLSTGATYAPVAIAACVGLDATDIVTAAHPPIEVSVGTVFVAVQVAPDALDRCIPDLAAFRAAAAGNPRLSLLVYARDGGARNDGARDGGARDGGRIDARMFAPIAGTWEDPATGSANAPLAALLLSLDGGDAASFTVHQGVRMGRPSVLHLTAHRAADGIRATVSGTCVPMFAGEWTDHTTG